LQHSSERYVRTYDKYEVWYDNTNIITTADT